MEIPLKKHPDVLAIQQQIATIDAQIQQIREVAASDDSPKLTPLLEDRQFYVQELENVTSQLRPRLQEQSREQHQAQLHSNLGELRKQIELNESEKQFLREQMESIDTTIVRTDAQNGVKLEMARHALERQTRLADGLVQALEQFKIECQSQPRIALIDLPSLPRQANRGRQWKATGTAAGAGWLAALLAVGFFEWRGQRVRRAGGRACAFHASGVRRRCSVKSALANEQVRAHDRSAGSRRSTVVTRRAQSRPCQSS